MSYKTGDYVELIDDCQPGTLFVVLRSQVNAMVDYQQISELTGNTVGVEYRDHSRELKPATAATLADYLRSVSNHGN